MYRCYSGIIPTDNYVGNSQKPGLFVGIVVVWYGIWYTKYIKSLAGLLG